MKNFSELDEINIKLQNLQNTKKMLQREDQSRKERTRRLIQTGALAEKYFNIATLTLEEKENFFKTASEIVKYKNST